MHYKNIPAFFLEQLALQRGQGILWAPVFLGLGIGAYFAIPAEPPLWPAALLLAGILAAAALCRRFVAARLGLLCLAWAALGFLASEIRTGLIAAPMLQKDIKAAQVTGTIESIEKLPGTKGSRVILIKPAIEKIPPAATPRKIRISIRADDHLSPGQKISVLAGLHPPSPPTLPQGFDFQRHMFFLEIGALGFAFKPPVILSEPPKSLFDFTLDSLRSRIDRDIHNALPNGHAAMVQALITGDRAGIPEDETDAFKAAGISHVISISGLHIGMVSGLVFFVTRFLMACFPRFALIHPIKKYAAVAGFAAAAFYTALAGAEVPALRSLVMAGMVYMAILCDRSPMSLRLVAVAALLVLLLQPEALITASFQMSFGAVAALVYFYDINRARFSVWNTHASWAKRAGLYFTGIIMTTVVATIATTPFTIYHFQQFTPYGLLGNMIAIPVTGVIVMPAAILALLAMPLGLEAAPLRLMDFGVDLILRFCDVIEVLPHALMRVPAFPVWVLIMLVMAALLGALLHGRARWMALLPVLIGFYALLEMRQPDILIAPDAGLAGLYDARGDLWVSSLRKGKFAKESWEQNFGLEKGSAHVWPKEGASGPLTCDDIACRAVVKNAKIAFLKKPEHEDEECVWADLVVSFHYSSNPAACAAYLIDKGEVLRNGSVAVFLQKGLPPTIETARRYRGQRPWTQSAAYTR